MGALDGVIVMLLYACFGVYVVMGLVLTILGIWYMGDAGAVGTTGIFLILTGLFMLVVGAVALLANYKQIWLILFIVELVNVALFLVMYIMIVIVVMMASGTTDPVRRATEESWTDTRASLTLPGSDGETSEGIYCEANTVANMDCQNYYTTARSAEDGCNLLSGATSVEELAVPIRNGLMNCSALGDIVGCAPLQALCSACDSACMEQQITDVKDAILPLSVFVFVVVVFLFITCTYNTILVNYDGDLSETGAMKIVGMILNGVVFLFAFILFIMGCIGAYQADDAGGDVPTSMILTILIGVAVFMIAGGALASIQLDNHLLLRLVTAIMVLLSVFLTLMALLLGISSGAVMDDMDYYYEVNYPKLRNAMEKADNTYCQMTKAQCRNLVTTGVPCIVLDEDGIEVEGSTPIQRADVWRAQHSEAALEAAKDDSPAWLEPCDTSGMCIYCDDFVEHIESMWVGVYDASANMTEYSSAIEGAYCDAVDAAQTESCIEAAPIINWTFALGFDASGPYSASSGAYGEPTNTGGQNWAAMSVAAGMTAEELADAVQNYTQASNTAPFGTVARDLTNLMGYCELAINDYVQNDILCPEDPTTINAGGYQDDCAACVSSFGNAFQFTFPNSGDDYLACSNFFYGHLKYECLESSAGSATCQDLFYGNAVLGISSDIALVHTNYMIDIAYEEDSRSKFCGYSDEACKAKIKDAVEDSMTSISVFGIIFLLFFLGIIYFTLEGIRIYKGDGSDDTYADADDE